MYELLTLLELGTKIYHDRKTVSWLLTNIFI